MLKEINKQYRYIKDIEKGAWGQVKLYYNILKKETCVCKYIENEYIYKQEVRMLNMIKHSSIIRMYENIEIEKYNIIVMEYMHSKDLAWVAKKEITDLFFFGHIIKAPRMISIDRENKAGIITLLKETKDRLDKGRPIAMFPEGTRSDGKSMLSFKAGAKMVANRYGLKVQPIILFNTRNIVDSKKLLANPGVVKIVYLEPVQADKNSNWYEETEEKMKERFNQESAKYI
jgi:1-acyl-sn-glycerol-3-phosphate acyltransferase